MAARVLRVLRTILLLLALILVVGAAVVYALSERRLRRRYPVAAASVPVRSDSAGVARVEHLYHTITCALCHGEDGGGAVYADAGPIAVLAGPI